MQKKSLQPWLIDDYEKWFSETLSPRPLKSMPELKTPVALTVFHRPDTLEKVFEAIRSVKPPVLFVIADAPRTDRPGEVEKCKAAMSIIDRVDWKCEVVKNCAETNMGPRKRLFGSS